MPPRRVVSRWPWAAVLLGLALLVFTGTVEARLSGGGVAAVSAENLKAAYLLNFMRFTDWPPAPKSDSYLIGVVGDRGLEDALLALADVQTVHERRLRVVRVRSARDATECQLVFFGRVIAAGADSALGVPEVLRLLEGRPVLTVGEDPGFLGLGGMVNFYREDERLKFEIAPDAVGAGGLVMSSRLLALARIVRAPATLQP